MTRFAANLSTLFTEYPVLDRFARAAACGFAAIEMQFPYDVPAGALARACAGAGLTWVLLNAPPGAAGERGLGCLPDRRAAFRDSVLRGLDYAAETGSGMLHVLAGLAPPDVPRDVLVGTFATNLAWAAEQAARVGVRLNLEPLNPRDTPGYFLGRLGEAEDMIRAVGAGNIGLQFDIYHCQRGEGDISGRLARHMPRIHHIQIADTPGRHEPGTGEVGWAHVFATIAALGYQGWVGCEYRPLAGTVAGLGWRRLAGDPVRA